MNEIEKLIEQLKVANERIEYLKEQRIKSASISINTLTSLNEAIIKIDRLEAELSQYKAELSQYKNADKTEWIINPEWETLDPEQDIQFPTEEDYKPINIGPEPKP
jgi:hypothetical protein